MDNRITELEIKLSFLEDQVDAQNTTIFRQQQQIDILIREIQSIRDQIRDNTTRPEFHSLRDEIPPHY